MLAPVSALLFMCAAGRGWPIHTGPDFPIAGRAFAHFESTTATLFVYSPDVRTMRLAASFQVEEPAKRPPLEVTIINGNARRASAVDTLQGQGVHSIDASVPLGLTKGVNEVQLALGSAADPTAFSVQSASVTRHAFNGGNLLFCLTLSSLAIASILIARALGTGGLDLFGSASLIGFILLTSSATILSLFHQLTGGSWAAAMIVLSLLSAVMVAPRLSRLPPQVAAPENTLRLLDAVVLLALVCPTFVMQMVAPLTRWDDLAYHGSRTGYWMQNASALPFVSHNDRLSAFPIGGDLLYACGTMISGSEVPGRFLVGTGYVLLLFAMLGLLRNAGIRPSISLGVTCVFAISPIVIDSAVGIKPDLWLVLWGVVALHWVLTAWRGNSGVSLTVCSCLAAASVGASCGIKWSALPLLALSPFALFLRGWRQEPLRRFVPVAVTFFAAIALGGAGPILLSNWRTFHHPLGSAAMRAWHQPDPGLHPVTVQLKRLPFALFSPPYLPIEPVRTAVDHWEKSVAQELGATEPLWRENDPGWPGRFVPLSQTTATGFSLGWFIIAAGLASGICLWRREDRKNRLTFLAIFGLALVTTLAVGTQTRWQASAGLPERFLVPAFAFALLAAAWPANWLLERRGKRVAITMAALGGLHALPFCALAGIPFGVAAARHWQSPANFSNHTELDAAAHLLRPGRTILLLAGQSCRDYPLFLSTEGFPNRVLPWGKAVYDSAAFDRALRQPELDTVIILSPKLLDMLWDPPLDARPFALDMDARPDFVRVPDTGRIFIYVRKA